MNINRECKPLQTLKLDRTYKLYSDEDIKSVRLRRDMAVLYAQVFAGEPWNERTRCPSCGAFSPEEGGLCTRCSTKLVPAYPVRNMIEYFKEELGKEGSVLAYALDGARRPVAFAWGYPTSIDQFVKSKYRTDGMRSLLTQLIQDEIGPDFFYFSECGVRPEMRRKGLATDVTGELLAAGAAMDMPILMRTNSASPMVRIATKVGMQQLPYYDGENLQRVMFIRR